MGEFMDGAEWRAFLRDGAPTGKLGVVRADGRPLVVPIWFVLDDDDVIRFQTSLDSAKCRAIAHEPRVCLTVDDQVPPFAFVLIDATAEIVEDERLMRRVTRDCGARYLGEDRADEMVARNCVPGECVVELRPIRVLAERNVSP